MDHATLPDGPVLEPATGPARGLVVLLHGFGADANDLAGLAPDWQQAVPSAAFVCPHAPEPCEGAPFGRQWFPLWNLPMAELEAGVRRASGALNAWLDAQLAARGLAPAQCVLMGFSQGAMTALFAALRRPAPVAGVMAFSGALLAPTVLAAEATARPPVLLVHGGADQAAPAAAGRAAELALRSAGVPVSSRFVPGLGHGIDPGGIEAGAAFLRTHLKG